jgi:hypothetical protein
MKKGRREEKTTAIVYVRKKSYNEQQLETIYAYLNNFNDTRPRHSGQLFSIMSLLLHLKIHHREIFTPPRYEPESKAISIKKLSPSNTFKY